MSKSATVNGIPLPSWTDPASVTSYLTSAIATVLAIVTAVHPGYTEPAAVQALLPAVGFVVAGVAQIVNFATHRSVQKAALAAGLTVDPRANAA